MLTRAQFLRRVAGGVAAVGAVPFLACDDSAAPVDATAIDAPVDAPPSCLAAGTRVVIATNHGHALAVSAQDVAAGQPLDYDIQGGADHPHTVSLTAAHLADLAANRPVTVMSVGGLHRHVVTIDCL